MFGIASHRVKKTMVAGVGWHASFPDALAEAKRSKKPILLLSMFGKLDEDMPCANARTLRATLFQDPEFKKLATLDLVPAWEMVRAVPKVQIDLGDGKKITRTVRGNAVLYLCKSDGSVVDVYPGVYTAKDFVPMVRESIAQLASADSAAILAYHRKLGRNVRPVGVTMGKAAVEGPTLNLLGARSIEGAVTKAESQNPERAKFLRAAAGLRDLSLTPMTPDEAVVTITGRGIEGRSGKEIADEILQADSANNIRNMRPVIHLYMASLKNLPTPSEARDEVLETILKIPYKDPYFGLKDVLLPGTPD